MSNVFGHCQPRFELFLNPTAADRQAEYPARLREILSLAEHEKARAEIRTWPDYSVTPLVPLRRLARESGIGKLWYKDESSRFGLGSFKALGSAFGVLRAVQRGIGERLGRQPSFVELKSGDYLQLADSITTTAATDGNHGRAVAWASRMFGCRCVIYVPAACSSYREAAIAQYGARVIRTTSTYDETAEECASAARLHGRIVVSGISSPEYSEIPSNIMQGYTVMVQEVLEALDEPESLTHVFVQAGVGGVAAAACAHFWERLGRRRPRIVVVEPEGAACVYSSARAGKVVSAPAPVVSVMAGLECGTPSCLAFEILSVGATGFATVSDDVTAVCMRALANPAGDDSAIIAGESAVAGLAGVLCAATRERERAALGLDGNSRVLVFGTEGDTDPILYRTLINASGSAPDTPH